MAYPLAADLALDALGDPTRRRVMELLRTGPRAVGDLAADLPVSRPAVSQHLRPRGTRHLYAIDDEGLAAIRTYLETFWDDALSAFKDAAERPPGQRTPGPPEEGDLP